MAQLKFFKNKHLNYLLSQHGKMCMTSQKGLPKIKTNILLIVVLTRLKIFYRYGKLLFMFAARLRFVIYINIINHVLLGVTHQRKETYFFRFFQVCNSLILFVGKTEWQRFSITPTKSFCDADKFNICFQTISIVFGILQKSAIFIITEIFANIFLYIYQDTVTKRGMKWLTAKNAIK